MARRSWVRTAVCIVLALASALGIDGGLPSAGPARSFAAPLSAPDNSVVLQPFVSGFTAPVLITHAGDGSGRLFVVEYQGIIKLVVNGQVRPTPYLDIKSNVTNFGEQGLLGLAFHPQYEVNGRFFVFYSARPPDPQTTPPNVGSITVEEYHVMEGNPELANPVPVRTLFAIPDEYSNHNGGMMAFGPDGYLYISMGDEGSGGDPKENAQNPLSLYGKMLRLDVNNGGNPNFPPNYTYSIPPTNPFVGNAAFRPEIWAIGFRNPWRWSFDRLTGDIFVGDVGQGAWEEIDFLPKGVGGLNFGWDDREGAHCFEPATGCLTNGRIDPILEYSRATNGGPSVCASITGGYRHRGNVNPLLQGIYFYADYCSGKIWKGVQQTNGTWTAVEALQTDPGISSFGEDEAGELFVVKITGEIFRLAQAPPTACSPGTRPRINVQTIRTGPGTLQVTATATTNAIITTNSLQSISFTRIDNARVSIGTQMNQEAPFTFPLPGGSPSIGFTAVRKQPGAMRVDVSVTDACGPWTTFVGGGANMP